MLLFCRSEVRGEQGLDSQKVSVVAMDNDHFLGKAIKSSMGHGHNVTVSGVDSELLLLNGFPSNPSRQTGEKIKMPERVIYCCSV